MKRKEEDDYIEERVHLRGNIVTSMALHDINHVLRGQRSFVEVLAMSISERVKVRNKTFLIWKLSNSLLSRTGPHH